MHVQALIDRWTFRALDEEAWYPAKVPGCVHTDLLRNGMISDPFYGTNETGLQWIDKKDWEYASEFTVTEEVLADYSVELVFEGLDTYADVYVNGIRVLFADNMFRTWRVNVKELLRLGSNSLQIRFRSPITEDLPKLEALGYALPAPNDHLGSGRPWGQEAERLCPEGTLSLWLGLGSPIRNQRDLERGAAGELVRCPHYRLVHSPEPCGSICG